MVSPIHGQHEERVGPVGAATQLPLITGVHIEGDDELANHSAVRSGSGTAEDPYVVANWTVVQTRFQPALHLEDTEAHVVLRDLWMPNPTRVAANVDGLRLANVRNVSVENVLVRQAATGVDVSGSANVSIERLQVGGQVTDRRTATNTGLRIDASRDVAVGNLTVRTSELEASITDSDRVLIHDATFRPSGLGEIEIRDTRDLSLEHANLSGTGVELYGVIEGLSVIRNRFDGVIPARKASSLGLAGNGAGLETVFRESLDGIDVCGNEFRDYTDAIRLWNVANLTVRGNLLEDNVDQVAVVPQGFPDEVNLTVERNVMKNASGDGLIMDLQDEASGAEIHHNTFANTSDGHVLNGLNASRNWWGHPSGPSGDFDGSGDAVSTTTKTSVIVDPPLEAPPEAGPGAVDCGVGERPVGAKKHPDLSYSLSAELSATTTVDETIGPLEAFAAGEQRVHAEYGPLRIPAELGPPLTREGPS